MISFQYKTYLFTWSANFQAKLHRNAIWFAFRLYAHVQRHIFLLPGVTLFQLLGYSLGFDITADGATVVSGSSDSKIYCYNYQTGKQFRTIQTDMDVIMDVSFHPLLPSTFACCAWDGSIQVWKWEKILHSFCLPFNAFWILRLTFLTDPLGPFSISVWGWLALFLYYVSPNLSVCLSHFVSAL